MSGLSWWSFFAFSLGMVLVGIDFKMTSSQKKKFGSYLLFVGIPFLLIGVIGMVYDVYVKWFRPALTATVQAPAPTPQVGNTMQPPASVKEEIKGNREQSPQYHARKAPRSLPASVQAQQPPIQVSGSPGGIGNVGGITAGPCSNVQVGGSGNQAQTNCGPIERHLTEAQKNSLILALIGKPLKLTFGALVNVPDSQQFAIELCEALKEPKVSDNCNIAPMMSNGSPWVGFKFTYKGDAAPYIGAPVSVPKNSPAGNVIGAFIAAGLGVSESSLVLDPEPNLAEDSVVIVVGQPAKH